LEELSRRFLARAQSPQFRAMVPASSASAPGASDELPARALAHFGSAVLSPAADARQTIESREAVLGALKLGAGAGLSRDVLRLARGAESSFIFGARWGLWDEILTHQLDAARSLNDGAAEAWAFHQRGTRALCLGNLALASAALAEALALRERLGDKAGAEVTRHNLSLIGAPPASATKAKAANRIGYGPRLLVIGLLLAAVGTAAALAARNRNERSVSSSDGATPTTSSEAIASATPPTSPPSAPPVAARNSAAPPDAPTRAVTSDVARTDSARAPIVAARPSAVTLVAPENGGTITCGDARGKMAVQIRWRVPAAAPSGARHAVEMRDAQDGVVPSSASDSAAELTLACGERYRWRVVTRWRNGADSVPSPWWSFALSPRVGAPAPAPTVAESTSSPARPAEDSSGTVLTYIDAKISAQPRRVVAGQPVRLCWNVAGADRVRIDAGVGLRAEREGCVTVTPDTTTTFTLTASRWDGQTERYPTTTSVVVRVDPRPR
ncbi:MAG: hypothetical protein M3081_11505, partial [Gemmatimonadota bacterium]|nr:hypothetical protein [Gemmatimonadota bacterium]